MRHLGARYALAVTLPFEARSEAHSRRTLTHHDQFSPVSGGWVGSGRRAGSRYGPGRGGYVTTVRDTQGRPSRHVGTGCERMDATLYQEAVVT